MKKQLSTALFAVFLAATGRGQGAHFTQMFHSGSYLNPALTGVFEQKAEYRAVVQYRQQWATLAPAYRDFMASVEKSGRAWQFGGLLYGHDAGAASLRTTGFRVSAALQKMLGPGQSALSLGLSLGVAQQRFDPAALTFSNQYDDEKGYLAAQSNGELFENTKQVRPDFAVGLGWQAHFFSEKVSPAAGVSLSHVAQPVFSAFQNGGYGLPTAFNWFARLGFRVDEKVVVTPFVWRLLQAGFSNKVYGADIAVKMPAATVHLSGGKRASDAILLKIGLDRGLNTLGLSYDMNTSKLRRASSGQGGWELAVSHYFNKKNAKPADTDRDGVPDKTDDCPLVMAKTPFGCPSATATVVDSDGDGMVDAKDRCPDEPGLIRLHGCPDTDGDGITDDDDQCPHLPGSLANNGCPLLPKDADDDGILDDDDHCPYIKGLAEFHGCPDTDGDGVPDLSDRCPFLRGPRANLGCPETGQTSTDDRIGAARERSPVPTVLVEFDHDRAEVNPQFFAELDQMAAWLYNHPAARLMLAGHTDAEGDGGYNFRLGLRRAQAVEDYFVARRIQPGRLELISYGETIPKSVNETASGKARNRRTEAIVMEK